MMAWGVWGWGQRGPVGKGLGAQVGGARTSAVDVVIWVPPEAPTTMRTWPSSPTMITGHMEERGCLPAAGRGGGGTEQRVRGHRATSPLPAQALLPAPGAMKLAGEGGTPNWLMMLGELKSSISSLNRIPLTRDRTLEPKLPTDRRGQRGASPPGPCPPTHSPERSSANVEPPFWDTRQPLARPAAQRPY